MIALWQRRPGVDEAETAFPYGASHTLPLTVVHFRHKNGPHGARLKAP